MMGPSSERPARRAWKWGSTSADQAAGAGERGPAPGRGLFVAGASAGKLVSALPEPRKRMCPRETRLDPYRPVIGAILTADLIAPRKQRHTVKRIYDRLLDEHDAVDISYQMVRAYVAGAARRSACRLARESWTRSSRRGSVQ